MVATHERNEILRRKLDMVQGSERAFKRYAFYSTLLLAASIAAGIIGGSSEEEIYHRIGTIIGFGGGLLGSAGVIGFGLTGLAQEGHARTLQKHLKDVAPTNKNPINALVEDLKDGTIEG